MTLLQKGTPIVDGEGRPTAYFYNWLASGYSGTITVPALTPSGTQGQLTYSNGLLTKVVKPT